MAAVFRTSTVDASKLSDCPATLGCLNSFYKPPEIWRESERSSQRSSSFKSSLSINAALFRSCCSWNAICTPKSHINIPTKLLISSFYPVTRPCNYRFFQLHRRQASPRPLPFPFYFTSNHYLLLLLKHILLLYLMAHISLFLEKLKTIRENEIGWFKRNHWYPVVFGILNPRTDLTLSDEPSRQATTIARMEL